MKNLIIAGALVCGAALLGLNPGCGSNSDGSDAGGSSDAARADAGDASLPDTGGFDAGKPDGSGIGPNPGRDGGCTIDDLAYWEGTFTSSINANFPSSGALGTSTNTVNESSSIQVTLRKQSGLRQRTWEQETDQDVIGTGSFDNQYVATISAGYVTDDFHVQGTAQDIEMSSTYPPCPALPSKVFIDLDACTYSIAFPCVQIDGTYHRVITPGQTIEDSYTKEVGGYQSPVFPLPQGDCPHLSNTQTLKVNVPVPLDGMASQQQDAVFTWDLTWPDC
jgi:hypothetical protein